MLMTALLPAIVAICGALVYAFAANPKLAELGRLLFFIGALWTVHVLSGKVLTL